MLVKTRQCKLLQVAYHGLLLDSLQAHVVLLTPQRNLADCQSPHLQRQRCDWATWKQQHQAMLLLLLLLLHDHQMLRYVMAADECLADYHSHAHPHALSGLYTDQGPMVAVRAMYSCIHVAATSAC